MLKKMQGTISSKSATLHLHTFNLYWIILGLWTTFQDNRQNYSWNINKQTQFRSQSNFDVLYPHFHPQHPQTHTGLYLSRLKLNFTSDYFSWVLSFKFPSTAFFFFPKQAAHNLFLIVGLQKRWWSLWPNSAVYFLDFSGEDALRLKPNKLIRSTYTYDPDSPAIVEACSGWKPTLLYRTVQRG